MSDIEHNGGISRRTLVKSTAIGSLALAAGGLSLPFGLTLIGSGHFFRPFRPPLAQWFGRRLGGLLPSWAGLVFFDLLCCGFR